MSDVPETAIPAVPTDESSYRLSPVGIEFTGELDHEGWRVLGRHLGSAGRSVGFLLGDWINYGEVKGKWGDTYTEAMAITGMEYSELTKFASVSRKVPFRLRSQNLSFEHHRKIAPLKTDEEKKKWLQVAEKERSRSGGKPMSSRRLAKSILAGRVVKQEEMSVPESDRGIDNVHPHVNRIVSFWRRLKDKQWLAGADDTMLEALLADLAPVTQIAEELREELKQRRDS